MANKFYSTYNHDPSVIAACERELQEAGISHFIHFCPAEGCKHWFVSMHPRARVCWGGNHPHDPKCMRIGVILADFEPEEFEQSHALGPDVSSAYNPGLDLFSPLEAVRWP